MRTTFCGLELEHPVINGSGTFDAIAALRTFGDALLERFPFAAFVSKTVTVAPRQGNPPPRLWEAPAGLINSIGLPNKGVAGYLEQDLPVLARLPVPLIVNVMGFTREEVATLVAAFAGRREARAQRPQQPQLVARAELGQAPGAGPHVLEQELELARPGAEVGEGARQVGALVRAGAPALGGGQHVELARPRRRPAGVGAAQEAVGADRLRGGDRGPPATEGRERAAGVGHATSAGRGGAGLASPFARRWISCSDSTSGAAPSRAAPIARAAALPPDSVVMHGIPWLTAALRIS